MTTTQNFERTFMPRSIRLTYEINKALSNQSFFLCKLFTHIVSIYHKEFDKKFYNNKVESFSSIYLLCLTEAHHIYVNSWQRIELDNIKICFTFSIILY